MPTAVTDREETIARLPKRSDLRPERKLKTFVFLAILILTGVVGMGVLCYKLEHPLPVEMFERR